MSDGMSDARAMGEIARDLEIAAMDLRDAIRGNRYRGMSVDVESTVNDILGPGCPYEIVRKPNRWDDRSDHRASIASGQAVRALHAEGLDWSLVRVAWIKLPIDAREKFLHELTKGDSPCAP